MESYQSSDDEVERLQEWFKHNGAYLFYAVTLGLALAFGIRLWRSHREVTRQAAASIYGEMLAWDTQGREGAVRVAVQKLERDYASTPYAPLGALMLAKVSYTGGDVKGATVQLRWAARHAMQPAIRAIADLRLGRVLAEEGQIKSALTLVSPKAPTGFRAQYEELRGDILRQEGHLARARLAYQAALRHLPSGSRYVTILKMKLADLGSST